MSTHHHNPAEYAARKRARQEANAAHGTGQNVPALRERLDTVGQAIGIVAAPQREVKKP